MNEEDKIVNKKEVTMLKKEGPTQSTLIFESYSTNLLIK